MRAVTLVVLLAGLGGAAHSQEGARFKLSIRVVDETGAPVEGSRVFGGAWNPYKEAKPKRNGSYVYDYDMRTDEKGIAVIQGLGFSDANIMVQKANYYFTETRYEFVGNPVEHALSKRWQPWNPTNTVLLKRVRQPVPMYVKSINCDVPVKDQFVGYDFEMGDWVSPRGKGVIPDLEFRWRYQSFATNRVGLATEYDSRLDVRCATPGGGVVLDRMDRTSGSIFWSKHEAPAGGYVRELTFYRRTEGSRLRANSDKDQCLYFRTRVTTNLQGGATEACYGKIYGDIQVRFLYFLNPDGTRNVEFDTNRNLLGNDSRSRVGVP